MGDRRWEIEVRSSEIGDRRSGNGSKIGKE
jgi:hypothetical protein